MEVNKLLRKNIKLMDAYASARSEYQGDASIWLDANENPFADGFNRYPDPLQRELKEQVGRIRMVPAGNIFLGNGSDEAIDLLMRAFCEPGKDNVMLFPPTYGMYRVTAAVNNIQIKEVPLNERMQPDVDAAINGIDAGTKILFFCSPNNPTGNLIDRSSILELAERFRGLVVVDEAYIDFAGPGSSLLPLLAKYPNLVILQTFSKAWGMAALRLGMAFASTFIIGVLNRIKLPYNIGLATQQLAMKALEDKAQVDAWIEMTIRLRHELMKGLSFFRCVLKIFPSDANFLLVKVRDADVLYDFLLSKKIVVRKRSGIAGCEHCLRITIGTQQEQELLLAAIRIYDDAEFTNSIT